MAIRCDAKDEREDRVTDDRKCDTRLAKSETAAPDRSFECSRFHLQITACYHTAGSTVLPDMAAVDLLQPLPDHVILDLLASGNIGDQLDFPPSQQAPPPPAPAPGPAPALPSSPLAIDNHVTVIADSPPPSPKTVAVQSAEVARLYEPARKRLAASLDAPVPEDAAAFVDGDPEDPDSRPPARPRRQAIIQRGGKLVRGRTLNDSIREHTLRMLDFMHRDGWQTPGSDEFRSQSDVLWSTYLERLFAAMLLQGSAFNSGELLCALAHSGCLYYRRDEVMRIIAHLTPSKATAPTKHATARWLHGYSQHGSWIVFRVEQDGLLHVTPAFHGPGAVPIAPLHSYTKQPGCLEDLFPLKEDGTVSRKSPKYPRF
jgi:hypothetical protein